jgi:carboxyl-terminal processing protease
MMTLNRMAWKFTRNMGWWNLVLLGGVWAWFSTPVDAQQKASDVQQKAQTETVQVARGFDNDDDGDSFPQSGYQGRSAIPANTRNDQFDDRPAQLDRNREQSNRIERIDLRPNGGANLDSDWGYGPRQRSRSNDESQFENPRKQRSNRPSYLDPSFPGPVNPRPGDNYQGDSNQGNTNSGFRGPAPRNLNEQNFNNQGLNSPSFNGPNFNSPNFNGQDSGYRTPIFQNPSLTRPVAPRVNPQETPVSPAQEAQTKITRRYQNQGFLSLLNLQPQEAVTLYKEVMQMIDTRHLEPASVQVRVQRGLTNLMYALDNPTFVQTNRLNLQPAGVQSFRSALQQAMQSPIQSEQDATNVLTWTMQASQQQLGLSPLPVALEFVYGAVESLDKYSAFVPPERNPGASLQLESNMVGIGVQIEMRDDGAEVMKVISGSPAQAAGLQKGDLILAVGGHQLSGVTIDQTVSLIAGPAGSPVVLGLQRRSQGPFTMTVTRQSITLHSVNDIQLLNGSKVGYFKLDKFTASANDEIENALQQLYRQGMQSLVVDLRGNPGGLLTAAIQISDKFLPDGTIVATRGRTASDNTEEHATRDHTWKVPLVVLVDHNSASASEIFAAAIQENRRGVVVGRTSYGKGTVQTQFPLQTAGCSLRITTARFYSPTGRVMAGSGVTPDVPVAEDVSGNDSGTYGVLDHDVQAALSVAQQGGFSNPNQAPNGNPGNMNPGQNQNLSSARGFSQPQMTQPFAQPQVPAGY